MNVSALSTLQYLASVIHVPNQVIKEIKDIVVDFIWDSKPANIAYSVMIQDVKYGGLKLHDFETKIKSLKLN